MQAASPSHVDESIKRAVGALQLAHGSFMASVNEIAQRLKQEIGFGVDALTVHVTAQVDAQKIGASLIHELISDAGRVSLNLNRTCEIPIDELTYDALQQCREVERERESAFRWKSWNRGEDEPESVIAAKNAPINLPGFDGIVAALQRRYSGEAGEQVRLGQLAAKLMTGLNLAKNSFDEQRGKVLIETRAFSDCGVGYGGGTRQTLRETATALWQMAVIQELPATWLQPLGAYRDACKHISPGDSIQLGPAGSVRFFKAAVKYSLSSEFAALVRNFIASHTIRDEQELEEV